MLDVDAAIEPGRALGGIVLGCSVDDLLALATPERVIELPGENDGEEGVTIHSFGAIRTWSVAGRVEQVGAFEGYRGHTAAGIGIGSTLSDVAAAYGALAPLGAENMATLPGLPGVGLETTDWAQADEPDPAACIVQLFVHAIDD